jgi:hypothetical protein
VFEEVVSIYYSYKCHKKNYSIILIYNVFSQHDYNHHNESTNVNIFRLQVVFHPTRRRKSRAGNKDDTDCYMSKRYQKYVVKTKIFVVTYILEQDNILYPPTKPEIQVLIYLYSMCGALMSIQPMVVCYHACFLL